MTELEILELALEGARARLDKATHNYELTRVRENECIEEIRTALLTYDRIKKMIEKCKKV